MLKPKAKLLPDTSCPCWVRCMNSINYPCPNGKLLDAQCAIGHTKHEERRIFRDYRLIKTFLFTRYIIRFIKTSSTMNVCSEDACLISTSKPFHRPTAWNIKDFCGRYIGGWKQSCHVTITWQVFYNTPKVTDQARIETDIIKIHRCGLTLKKTKSVTWRYAIFTYSLQVTVKWNGISDSWE